MITTNEFIDSLRATNYVRKANRRNNYWFDLSKSRIEYYSSKYRDRFNLILFSEYNTDHYYYIIPYYRIKDLLSTIPSTTNRKRWIGSIKNHILKVTHYPPINVEEYYEKKLLPKPRLTTVKNWEEILNNLNEFLTIDKNIPSKALDNFSSFFNWYYFPNEQSFAPSKFIGYTGTTIENYLGEGNGGQTTITLNRFFYKIGVTDKIYTELKSKLLDFASSLEKGINHQTFYGNGGIYYPKKEYAIKTDKTLYSICKEDIASFDEEYNGIEGKKGKYLTSKYERLPKYRSKAVKIHGTECKACGFDFVKTYGPHGKDFIEVHHLKPLYTLDGPTSINPEIDMTVLCANCHRMIHRNRKYPLSMDQLIELLRRGAK